MAKRTEKHDTILDEVSPFLREEAPLLDTTLGTVSGRADWRRIWLATQSRPWRALAIVPGDDGLPTFEVASRLMWIGRSLGDPICVADLRGATHYAGAFLEIVAYHVSRGERIVMPTYTTDHDLTIPIARGADCVLLCVALGSTRVRRIEETLADVGKDRFVGSILLNTAPTNGVRHRSRRRPALLKAQG
jgi:hypothetical protein